MFLLRPLFAARLYNRYDTFFLRHCSIYKTSFTKDDNFLVNSLYELKGYNARYVTVIASQMWELF